MNRSRTGQADSIQRIRAELVSRLRARSVEIEEAVFARVVALSEPSDQGNPEYTAGLRAAIGAAVDYAFMSIEDGPDWSEPIPLEVTSQARRAARVGIRLDTVLRRYAAGDRLLGEFIMDEGNRFSSQALRQVLRAQGAHVDRLMATVAAEYMKERERMRRSPTQRVAEQVQRLLAGDDLFDLVDLSYDFDAWHLGMIVSGETAAEVTKALALALDSRLLLVPHGNGVVWAWLGKRRRLSVSDVERVVSAGAPSDVSLAVGEPRQAFDGWRLTHHEAQAALEVMLRQPQKITRSSDVVLLAAVLRDERLAKSLRETFLTPLDEHGDFGVVLRETLRAYFSAGGNAATAAAALGVDRHTVQRRLRKVEEALGRLLSGCHAQLEVALTLEEFDGATKPERPIEAPA